MPKGNRAVDTFLTRRIHKGEAPYSKFEKTEAVCKLHVENLVEEGRCYKLPENAREPLERVYEELQGLLMRLN